MLLPLRRETAGVLAACASSMLGGTAVVATRAVIGELDPATLGALRYGLGAAILLPLVFLAGLRRPAPGELMPVLLLGLLFFTLFPWLFNRALASTTAARGALALSTMPFLTLVLAAAWGMERLAGRKLAGIACASAGVAAALWGGLATAPAGAWRGDLLMVATAACGALYNVLASPYLRRCPAPSFTAFAMLAGTVGMAGVALATGAPGRLLALDAWSWLAVAWLGIAGAALALYLWSFALERIPPSGVAVTVTLNPVVALALGTLLLGEPWSAYLLLGFAAIAAGVLLVNLPPRRQPSPLGAPATASSGSTP